MGFTPKSVLIVGYSYDAPQVAHEVADYLRSRGITSSILSTDPWNEPPGACSASVIDEARSTASSSDLIIVLGGDGSFLRGTDLAHGADIPIIGMLVFWQSLKQITSGMRSIDSYQEISQLKIA